MAKIYLMKVGQIYYLVDAQGNAVDQNGEPASRPMYYTEEEAKKLNYLVLKKAS